MRSGQVVGDRLLVAAVLDSAKFCPAINPEKLNTEDTKDHREPQRNRIFFFRRLSFPLPSKPSVISVAFLCVLCVNFRKARTKEERAMHIFRRRVIQGEACKPRPSSRRCGFRSNRLPRRKFLHETKRV